MLTGVFFAPLLVLFVLTGCWQTVSSDEEKERQGGWMHTAIQRLSTIHTDSYFPPQGHGDHSHALFKALVVSMGAGLLVSVVLGLALAAKTVKEKWLVGGTLVLGILVPVVLLWFG